MDIKAVNKALDESIGKHRYSIAKAIDGAVRSAVSDLSEGGFDAEEWLIINSLIQYKIDYAMTTSLLGASLRSTKIMGGDDKTWTQKKSSTT